MLGQLAGGLRSTCWSFLSDMFYSSSPSPAEAMPATALRESSPERVFGADGEGGGSMCESMHVEKDSDPGRAEVRPSPSIQHQSMNTHACTHTHL